MSPHRAIHLIYGPQGAGKTTYARALTAQLNGIRLSIDEWMMTLYGPDLHGLPDLTWVLERVQRCERTIWTLTQSLLDTRTPVILDLGFLRAEDRLRFTALAEAASASVTRHLVEAPAALRLHRVLNRNEERGDTYALHVTPEMFEVMDRLYEPPDHTERSASTVVAALHA